MKSILIRLDDRTHRLLERVAPAAQRRRARFIRAALLKAAIEAEEARTRAAYRRRPDAESDADDWSSAEKFQP